MAAPVRPGALRLHSTTQDGVATVAIAGELDIATIAQLRAHARAALHHAARQLILDVSHVSFIDATGLGTLIAIQHLASRQGTSVLLTGATPHLRDLIRIARLEGHFTLTPP